jgi:hypothetical protein
LGSGIIQVQEMRNDMATVSDRKLSGSAMADADTKPRSRRGYTYTPRHRDPEQEQEDAWLERVDHSMHDLAGSTVDILRAVAALKQCLDQPPPGCGGKGHGQGHTLGWRLWHNREFRAAVLDLEYALRYLKRLQMAQDDAEFHERLQQPDQDYPRGDECGLRWRD